MHTNWQHPWLDVSRAPLLVQNFPRETTDEELRAFLAAVEGYLGATPGPFVWVADASNLLHASAAQRRLFADFEKRTEPIDRARCLGTALVVKSRIARTIITAVYWASPPVYPYRFFADFPEAEVWARGRLAEAGLSAR